MSKRAAGSWAHRHPVCALHVYTIPRTQAVKLPTRTRITEIRVDGRQTHTLRGVLQHGRATHRVLLIPTLLVKHQRGTPARRHQTHTPMARRLPGSRRREPLTRTPTTAERPQGGQAGAAPLLRRARLRHRHNSGEGLRPHGRLNGETSHRHRQIGRHQIG